MLSRTGPPDSSGRTCAVLGQPIAHSLSPAMHRAAYAELGLDWSYRAVELPAGAVAGFVAGLGPEWRGLSVTMPLKAELLDLPGARVDELAQLTGVGNTVIIEDDGGLAVWNTDAPGIANALTRNEHGARYAEVAIIGSGATARSALVGLSALGARHALVAARSADKAAELGPLADQLGIELAVHDWAEPLPAAELVVSTLPGGALDDRAAEFANAPTVFDLSYHPWPSALARAATAAGATVLDGIDLLADQAALQVRLMTGRGVAPGLLAAAARDALGDTAARSS